MAEPTQYTFELKESVVALIKEQGIHEGLWTLGVELTLGAGSFGPTPPDARPGAFMQINKLQLGKQQAHLRPPLQSMPRLLIQRLRRGTIPRTALPPEFVTACMAVIDSRVGTDGSSHDLG